MKIGLDVAQTAAERAGCAWYADALARALVKISSPQEHEFVLYHQFGDWINGQPEHGTCLPDKNVSMPLRNLMPVEARALWRKIEAGQAELPEAPDIVVAASFHAPRVGKAQLLYIIYDLVFWVQPQFSTHATRMVCQRELGQALGRSAALLFASECTRHDFESFYPGWLQTSGRPHAVAGGASRWPLFSRETPPSPTAPWLMVGSVEPRKNHACALDAYEIYVEQATEPRPLKICGGRGWHSASIHARIDQLVARKLPVEYAGYVDERTLQRNFRESFALLQPSWHEGFGLPVLEAFSQGLPVIASNTASLPEVSGGAALHCSPAQPAEWAKSMQRLDQDPTLWQQLAQAGLTRSQDYGWEKTAKTVLELAQTVSIL